MWVSSHGNTWKREQPKDKKRKKTSQVQKQSSPMCIYVNTQSLWKYFESLKMEERNRRPSVWSWTRYSQDSRSLLHYFIKKKEHHNHVNKNRYLARAWTNVLQEWEQMSFRSENRYLTYIRYLTGGTDLTGARTDVLQEREQMPYRSENRCLSGARTHDLQEWEQLSYKCKNRCIPGVTTDVFQERKQMSYMSENRCFQE